MKHIFEYTSENVVDDEFIAARELCVFSDAQRDNADRSFQYNFIHA